jgi:3D (Asp-Asp-Asp) domain-containing protein
MWKSVSRLLGVLAVTTAGLIGCTSEASEEAGDTSEAYSHASGFRTKLTGYYPDSSALEGGFKDRLGKPLHTLQQYLNGDASYVSVAMDSSAFAYGTKLRIPSLEAKYGRRIEFRVVDTGGAFRGKGTSRMDVCVASYKASLDPVVNGSVDVEVVGASSSSSSASSASSSGASSSGGGADCRSDGDCNPGNDGSGKICSAGSCVPGCHADYHCPGSTRCVSGSCR